ncbi:MAG TPA: glycine betaine ABC transporter substrate-binding protein [Micromonospora sp.]|nr:glycine betaine ABC transporter substrate-binding protein [Micromonospora sp.]
MRRQIHRLMVGITGLVTAGALAACGGGGAAVGSVSKDLDGAKFAIGAKDFSEQSILAEITAQLLRAHGAEAEVKEIKGSVNTRKALESGELSMYWEYTGTAWITYLQQTTPIPDAEQQYAEVAAQDLEKNGIKWFAPADFNNTYAISVSREKAEELGVSKLSDLAALEASKPEEMTFCIESEFSIRDDGFPGMTKAYGIEPANENIRMLDTGLIYTEVDKAESCIFGEAFATDGRIAALDLVVLEDDKNFFPIYEGAVTMKQETLDANPKLESILAPLAEKLDTVTMQSLNAQVDVDGEDPADVAEEWLTKVGLLS